MATPAGLSIPLDVNNVQGDILSGFVKNTETNLFFRIKDGRVDDFRKGLAKLVPFITTTGEVLSQRHQLSHHKQDLRGSELLKIVAAGIAFSKKGLDMLGITDDIGDTAFNGGMLSDASNLGDKPAGNPDWIPEFKQVIHGIIIVAGDSHASVTDFVEQIETLFGTGSQDSPIEVLLSLQGDVRPGKERGHEHFGFLDCISQPAVIGVNSNLHPGQEEVRVGIVLCGREGDVTDVTGIATRPSWALDGSFLAFRFQPQLVPEFHAFLKANPIRIDDPLADPDLGSELLGARMVGRWKSGAPVDLTPLRDNPALGPNAARNNNFRYDLNSQERCPFAAHTRKTNPRSDLPTTEIHRIIRRGIPFGPEVSQEETKSGRTTKQRGLLFKCYQSSIVNGFQFVQKTWSNNVGFPIRKPQVPGFDPIIGQDNDSFIRTMSGADPNNVTANLTLSAEWVLSKGGEYFFAPSISTLRDTFALKA